ncbi:MAG: site-2 protease family protein, partial [Clostridiales bacterium]|nr:site-2 protease family protein [Clostridiales bacterium]
MRKVTTKLVAAYFIVSFIVAIGATVFLAYNVINQDKTSLEMWLSVGAVAFLLLVLMCGGTIFGGFTHELGHTVFAALAGFRTVQFSIGKYVFTKHGIRYDAYNEAAGATAIFPKTEKNIRQRYAFVSLGGIIFNLVYGSVFLTLYFVLPHHPALVFFELLAPMNLFTGLLQLLPIPRGRTDFMTFYGCLKNKPFAQIACNILQAQSILYQHSYRAIPRELLYDTPVIREDDPLFILLLTLRLQYCLVLDDIEGVKAAATRMDAIYIDEDDSVDGDVASLLYYLNKIF